MNLQRSDPGPTVSGLVLCVLLCSVAPGLAPLRAQASLPATAPTAVTPSQLPSANPPVAHGPASVQWDGHLLQITATGESLTEVLSEIAARAGIRMTGSAPDDRIYGTYGPAPLVDVLSELVSGLAVNMLFVERSPAKPAQLTFTARNGAATPPSPAAQQQQQSVPPQLTQQPQPPSSPQRQQMPPTASPPEPQLTGAAAATTGTQTTDANGNPTSPNGVKTPQEIFEQLQRLRASSPPQR